MAAHDNSYKLLFSHAEMVRDLLLYMPVRIMTYLGLLYQDLIRTGQCGTNGRLPPVLPVVLYNGKPRWQAPVEISDLIEQVSGGLEQYRPRLSFLLLDEGSFKDEELKPLKNLVSALFRLEKGQDAEQLMDVVTSLLQWLATPEQASLRRAFTVWFNRVLNPARKVQTDNVHFEELTEVKTMLAETVKEWRHQWKEEGRQEGQIQGQIGLLIKQLELKFGPLSEDLRSRISAADDKELSVWGERILSARTLEEVVR